MWRWMLPGGIVLGAALGGIIAASPHPARTAGDVTAIVVVVRVQYPLARHVLGEPRPTAVGRPGG